MRILNRHERLAVHNMNIPPEYLPRPNEHMANQRDYGHFMYALKWLESIKARRVLDVGCFDGWLDFLLIDRGFYMVGIEFIDALANAARRYALRNKISYVVYTGDAQYFDFNHNAYDAVICYEMLEHVPEDTAQTLIKRFSTWAPNVLISVPNQEYQDNPQHCWTPTAELLDSWYKEKPGKTEIEYKEWPGTTIPGNWFVKYNESDE